MHALSAAFFARRMSSSAPAILSFLSRAAAQHFCRLTPAARGTTFASGLRTGRREPTRRQLPGGAFRHVPRAALAAPGRPLCPNRRDRRTAVRRTPSSRRRSLVTALVGKGCCVPLRRARGPPLPPHLLDRCAAACAANPSCVSFAIAVRARRTGRARAATRARRASATSCRASTATPTASCTRRRPRCGRTEAAAGSGSRTARSASSDGRPTGPQSSSRSPTPSC